MEESAGRFEKRFILDSLLPEGPVLLLSLAGAKLHARLASVDSREILLEAEGGSPRAPEEPGYILDIPFRGLVFRCAGSILSREGSKLRIPLSDPWRLLSSPAPSREGSGGHPVVSIYSKLSRFELSWPLSSTSQSVQDLSAFASRLSSIAKAFGMEADFRLPRPDGESGPLESLLLAAGRPLVVLDTGIPEDGSELFAGFSFLGRSEYESLLAFEGGKPGLVPPPGFHLGLRRPSGLSGLIRVLPCERPFSSFGPASLFRVFALESLFSLPALPSGPMPPAVVLSLQADGMILSLDPATELASSRDPASVRALLSFPGRDIHFSARVLPIPSSGSERLAFLSFEGGPPEDYRFLFETLYGVRFDGAAADHLIKKAAP